MRGLAPSGDFASEGAALRGKQEHERTGKLEAQARRRNIVGSTRFQGS